MYTKDLMQRVQFLSGEFKPSVAKQLCSKMIDEQINFYKLQNLSQWIGNNNLSPDILDDKIATLHQRKNELNAIINKARDKGSKVNIYGDFKIEIQD